MKKLLSALGFCALVAAPGAASAAAWGAVCIGPGGAYGYAYGWATSDQAYNAALEDSEYDCTEIRTFYNSCGAMAEGVGGWGWGTGGSRAIAESTAMNYCRDYAHSCRVRVWACSG